MSISTCEEVGHQNWSPFFISFLLIPFSEGGWYRESSDGAFRGLQEVAVYQNCWGNISILYQLAIPLHIICSHLKTNVSITRIHNHCKHELNSTNWLIFCSQYNIYHLLNAKYTYTYLKFQIIAYYLLNKLRVSLHQTLLPSNALDETQRTTNDHDSIN